MTSDKFVEMPCDVCGTDDAAEISCAPAYTKGQHIHVCKQCGFVYVKMRRSFEAVADTWSHEIYSTRNDKETSYSDEYTPRIPAVIARLTFVAEVVRDMLDSPDGTLCDIGAGEGVFLDIVRQPSFGLNVFGIEPSENNCRIMTGKGIDCYAGTIEAYMAQSESPVKRFDNVTIMWTLENCQSCRAMLEAAYTLLDRGGHLLVATGSRILVPFKKPLHYYLGGNLSDTHAFRFSANTLQHLLETCGFEIVYRNRYIDSDILCVVAQKVGKSINHIYPKDNYQDVLDFFERWHQETQTHYMKAIG